MKVKRFFAPDMSSAMRLVRDEVGPDAVILSNSSVAGGVEVVVALEYSEVSRPEPAARAADGRRNRQVNALVGRKRPSALKAEMGRTRTALASSQEKRRPDEPPFLKAEKDQQLGLDDAVWDDVLASLGDGKSKRKPVRRPASAPVKAVKAAARAERPVAAVSPPAASVRPAPQPEVSEEQQTLQQMRNEIDELKGLLRARLAENRPAELREAAVQTARAVPASSPVRERIYKRLKQIGLADVLAERLVQAIEADTEVDRAWKIALARLAEALPVVGENIADRGGILAFVGATGVGKTTTIGKLAAQYVLKHGSSSVALVTTDSYRIAAHEQLRTFGRILDIPVRVVDENRSLDDALHSLRDKRLVLVDTSGLSTSAGQREEQLEMLSSSTYRIKKFLVLPCTAQQRVLETSAEQFRSLGLNGVVLSKVDESLSLGEAISTVIEQRLPVAYLGDGQKIPDSIEVARANVLVSRAVILADQQARAERARVQQDDESDSLPVYASTGNAG